MPDQASPLVQQLDALAKGAAAGLNTQQNRVLPAASPVPAIPPRVGAIKNKPESWKDYFFQDAKPLQGS